MKVSIEGLRFTLREALKKHDADRVAASLEAAAKRIGSMVFATVDASQGMLNVFVKYVNGNEQEAELALTAAADEMGWSLLSKNAGSRGVVWWFEPKPITKGPVKASRLPALLYHATLDANVQNILENGLTPRVRQFGTARRYSPRIYLSTSEGGAKAITTGDHSWQTLIVDVRLLARGTKFYVDQEFGYNKNGNPIAVYTLDPIPAAAIKLKD